MRYAPWMLALACGTAAVTDTDSPETDETDETDVVTEVVVTEASFGCLTEMDAVRRYRATNLLGDTAATLAVAADPEGKVFPPGSLLQLVPAEAMVKREPGFAPETDDWEFFFLNVSAEGTEIVTRGPDAKNAFGGNCADCHAAAEARYDWVCEDTHGCVELPLTSEAILSIQEADPRCP